MKPAEFNYRRPGTLAEAVDAYAQANDAKILAGGQSLIPLLSMRLATVGELIDINGIPELARIAVEETGVRFGAIVRHTELLENNEVAAVQPLIRAALQHVAHATIRNRGTTVGSIVHADAAGEMPTVFTMLDGALTVQSIRGTREIPASELFLGALETSLAEDEIATEVFLPSLPENHGVAFEEVARRHGDYALCAVGAIVGVAGDGKVTSVRTGYVSVSDIPVAIDLNDAFTDGELSAKNINAAGELALTHLEPESDVHATARYRAQLVRVLTDKAIRKAYDDALTRTQHDSKGAE